MRRTTIFTCSIYPDITRVWYHFVRRYTDASLVSVLIYDCGSRLLPEHFAGARIVRHRNLEHGKKIDHALATQMTTPYMFLTDDDSFLISGRAEPLAAEVLAGNERCAAVSFKPRGWWEFEIAGRPYPVMGSYSVVFKTDVVKETGLSFRSRPTDDPKIRKGTGCYDTADFINQHLITNGFEVFVPAPDVRDGLVRSFSAVSSGFVNFARRGWFRPGYRLTRSRSDWAEEIGANSPILERACGVAATIALYRRFFGEEPRFSEFFSYDDLMEIASQIRDEAVREKSTDMVRGYRSLLRALEEAA